MLRGKGRGPVAAASVIVASVVTHSHFAVIMVEILSAVMHGTTRSKSERTGNNSQYNYDSELFHDTLQQCLYHVQE